MGTMLRWSGEHLPNTRPPTMPPAPADTANPKLAPDPDSNTEKDPADWVSGDDPMTGAQASYLKTLAEQTHEPEAFSERLTKAEASRRIDVLKAKLKLFEGPPHPA
jgi:Protein of unknown function (DUF3072)